jgi:hypothetical protein
MIDDDNDQLIPSALVAKMLGITPRAKREREKHDPDFPATYWFNGRKYNKKGETLGYIELRRAASETKKNAGWQVTQTHARNPEGKFSAATTEPVMRQKMSDELAADAAETRTIMQPEC